MTARRVVMITGAAGNLGRAVAQAFAREGAQLILVDASDRRLTEHFGVEMPAALLLAVDLVRAPELAQQVAQAVERFGRVDVLCNIAGGFRMGPPVHETGDELWDLLVDMNVRTLLHAVRAVVPHMIAAGGGAIVNVGAYAALKGAGRSGAYTAAKSAVVRLTEAMAAELREQRINVNCVLPTILDTPENRADMPQADATRWVAPADLANVIVFLASDAARAVHGAAIPVTGLS
jgi:NAD(P)-dependent dehydrogenase (short-subunit alcohol dehydrogenase family)